MKRREKKGKILALAGMCMLVLCFGCGQEDGAAQGIEEPSYTEDDLPGKAGDVEGLTNEIPDSAYVSGEDLDSDAVDGEEVKGEADGGQELEDGLLGKVWGGRSLTPEELQEYSEWIQERSNYGFLLSEWENPTQVDLYEVFYNGAGISREGTEAEKKAYLDRNGLQEINTDFYAMDKAAVSAMLLGKVGLSYDELVAKGSDGLENWYDAETDSFCTEAGDTNYVKFICTDGVINEEGTRVILRCDGDEWVKTCEVEVAEGEGERGFLGNHIIDGLMLDVEEESVKGM